MAIDLGRTCDWRETGLRGEAIVHLELRQKLSLIAVKRIGLNHEELYIWIYFI